MKMMFGRDGFVSAAERTVICVSMIIATQQPTNRD
jgi:hypothetical protein